MHCTLEVQIDRIATNVAAALCDSLALGRSDLRKVSCTKLQYYCLSEAESCRLHRYRLLGL